MHLQDRNIDVSLPQQLAHIKDWVIVDLISLTKINVIVVLSYTLYRAPHPHLRDTTSPEPYCKLCPSVKQSPSVTQ